VSLSRGKGRDREGTGGDRNAATRKVLGKDLTLLHQGPRQRSVVSAHVPVCASTAECQGRPVRSGVGLWRSYCRTFCLSRALFLLPRTDCMCLASRTMMGRAPQPVKLSRRGRPPGSPPTSGPAYPSHTTSAATSMMTVSTNRNRSHEFMPTERSYGRENSREFSAHQHS